MLDKLNGIFLIGTCTKKEIKDYNDKNGNNKKSYKVNFDYMGGTNSVNVDEVIYAKLEEGLLYVLEVRPYTNENMKGNILLSQKGKQVYEITDTGLFEA